MSRMPSRRGSVPSPLAGLPRPLDDRPRRSRIRRLLRSATLVLLVGGIGSLGYRILSLGTASASGDGEPNVATVASDGSGAAAPGGSAAPGASSAPVVIGAGSIASPTTDPPAGIFATPAPLPTPRPIGELTGYRWPLPHGRLTLPFGPTGWGSRIVDGEKFHDGMDLATFCGDHVVAAHDGLVLAAGRDYDHLMGWVGDLQPYLDRLAKKKLRRTLPIVVVVDDGNGYRSIYAHFSKVVVKKGQTIRAGDFIGYEGMTGHATGCHVHYGLFSPLETATFGIDPGVVKRMKTPAAEIARIDPALVLPRRPDPTRKPSATPST